MIRNVICDWSGTLADDLTPVLEATNRVFAHYGKPVYERERFRREFSLPFVEFYARTLPGIPMEELDALYHRHFDALNERVELLPGAREFLELCRETGRRLFLLSTINPLHWAKQGPRLEVTEYFEHAYVGILDKRKKIGEILRTHQLDAGETVFIGDMEHDIVTAKEGGVMAIGVSTGYDPAEKLLKANPDLLVQDLEHLRRFLHERPVLQKMPVSTVGALIFNPEGKMLMVHTTKWSDTWGIPGGKIKRGESQEEALRREILEETGLVLRDIRFVFVQDCIDSPEFHEPAHFLLLNYTGRTEQTEVSLNDEADNYRWVTMDEARAMNLNQPTVALLDVLEARNLEERNDSIAIAKMVVETRIGVPDEERSRSQKLVLNAKMYPLQRFNSHADELVVTTDYAAAAELIRAIAGERPRKLIETLAAEIAEGVLAEFDEIGHVEIELRKYILPQTGHVAVRLCRSRGDVREIK